MKELKKALWEMTWKLFLVFIILGNFIGFAAAFLVVACTAGLLLMIGIAR